MQDYALRDNGKSRPGLLLLFSFVRLAALE